MNTVAIDSNIYKGAEFYAKLHKISVEAVIEKGLTLLLGKMTLKKEVLDEDVELEKAMKLMDTMMIQGGKPVPADVDPMAIFVQEKYGL